MYLGIDIVSNERIKMLYQKHGEAFLSRVFTPKEIEQIANRKFNIEHIAARFALKEAASKAYGTGIGKRLSFKDIEILSDINNRPICKIKGVEIAVSISHEREFSTAIAMLGNDFTKIDFDILKKVPKRNPDGHKGTFGRALIFAGSYGMLGAGYLSSNACLKTGAGLVYNYVPESIFESMSIKQNSVIVKKYSEYDEDTRADAIAIGPGIGVTETSLKLLKEISKRDLPMVIDADALNLLSQNRSLISNFKNKIFTPHDREFERFGYKLKSDTESRIEIAKQFAKEYGIIVLLKGSKTIVTDGKRHYINNSGNSGMATAGSGDVLTGIITGLLAQGVNSYDAAVAAAYIHGKAGEIAAKKYSEYSLTSMDILDNICGVFKHLEKYRNK
ncbi:MAG: NAD(P)H-hydrate dehydratase [Tissierellia bacterium]|nr:NAD(P)H-hydrate dehydratase [Tissierellia bacterium]